MCKECHRTVCPASCPNYEPKQVYTCDYCENPIYEGDTYYHLPDDTCVCEDCITADTAEVSE